ncbi:MAG TPA: hypothetical protein VK589_26985 [Chryseolinea sp.]|nr:hypothetical protein [Chryseolinea sp.]
MTKHAMITPLLEVDFQKVRQKTVKKFIAAYGLSSPTGFTDMRPECYNPSMESSYHLHTKTFLIQSNIDCVWNAYKTIHPKDAWNGAMVSFGLQYSRMKNSINYINDDYSGMEKGQIIILNLRLLWGGINIAVAHEVSEVNEQFRMIRLCYMRGGASEGSQIITMRETKDGFTEVLHKTLYKSKSNFRDKTLYPRLHTKAITEFHLNVKKKAEGIKPAA